MKNRRHIFRSAAGASTMSAGSGSASPTKGESGDRKTYVLVHGGFHGGWCWKHVAEHLRTAGHRVFTPTQTGLGERAHLLNADVGIETFVQDIVGVVEAEELSDVILVGHSFGGIAVSGTADRLRERIRHVVYLDALIPEMDKSVFDQIPKDVVAARLKLVQEHNGVQVFLPFKPEAFGVTEPAAAQWLARRMTPHPAKTYSDVIQLDRPAAEGLRRTYVRCTDPMYGAVEDSARRARSSAGWNYVEIPTGHDAMVTAPAKLASLLLGVG